MLSKENAEIYEAWIINVARTKRENYAIAQTFKVTEKNAYAKILEMNGTAKIISFGERVKWQSQHSHIVGAIKKATEMKVFIPKEVFKKEFFKIFWEFESEEEDEYIKAALRKA